MVDNMVDNIKVRMIQENDISVVAQFEKEISIISFGDEAVTDLDFHRKKIKKAMAREQDGMLVLEVEEKVAGWLWMSPKTNFITNEIYINFRSFYIAEDQRGSQGVYRLMDAGMDYCRRMGAQNIIGKVHVKNLPMRAVYKNYGFEPTHLTMEYTFKDKSD